MCLQACLVLMEYRAVRLGPGMVAPGSRRRLPWGGLVIVRPGLGPAGLLALWGVGLCRTGLSWARRSRMAPVSRAAFWAARVLYSSWWNRCSERLVSSWHRRAMSAQASLRRLGWVWVQPGSETLPAWG